MRVLGIAIFILQDYNNSVSVVCKVSTLLCRSYQNETIGRSDTMQQARELPACPVETTLMLIGDKWKVLILRDLLPGTKRFGELKKSIGSVSQKVLTAQLRDMEEKGLVNRKVYAEVPPRVEYSLTDLGKSLKPILDAMWTWGESYKAQSGK
jgi:DNA-binding HxlR family transcriptional regulator